MEEHRYVVVVTAPSRDEANAVMVERIYHDEDYGFAYSVDVLDEDGKPWT
jgi:hypothetical protein